MTVDAKYGVRNPAHDLVGGLDQAQSSGLTVLVDACSAHDEGQWFELATAHDGLDVFVGATVASSTALGRVVDLGSFAHEAPHASSSTVVSRLDASVLEVPGEANRRFLVDRRNGLTPRSSLLLVDLGTLTGTAAIDRVVVRGTLARLPAALEWAGILLSATDPVTESSAGGWSPRAGLAALRSAVEEGGAHEGTRGIGFVEPVPHAAGCRSFVVHYATPDAWRRYRLVGPLDPRAATELAAQIVESRFYGGAGFSAGDAWVEGVANGDEDPADEHGWRLAELSHHVAQLADDVRSLR
jgi:hypothetical protein